MGIFSLSMKDRRAYVAKCLGYNPDEPESWPMERVDHVLSEAEYAAERKLNEIFYHLARSR